MRTAVFAGVDELADALAAELVAVLRDRQADGAIPCVVLTGGTGGAAALAALARRSGEPGVDWSRVRFLWGDERWLPTGDPARNDRLADDSLFAAVRVSRELVHRAAASDSGTSLDAAAADYAGVGPDGHVASLFPGRPELRVVGPDAPSAVAVRDSPKPPPERISLTAPALNRADRVWLIAAGAGKRDAVADLFEPRRSPAAALDGRIETVLWTDEAAAAG